MKVLHVAVGNIFGGVETGTIAFVKAPRRDLEQEVAVFFDHGRLAEELVATGTRVHVLGPARVRYPWTILRARRRMKRVLRRGGFDAVIVHSPWSHGILAPVIRDAGLLLVHSMHGFLDPTLFLERWASWSKPDLVIANSNATKPTVEAVFPGVPIVTIHPPVTAPEPTAPTVRRTVRAALGSPEDSIVVITACRLEHWKGHHLLLEAVAKLDDRFVIWIAGGAQRPEEKAYLAELERLATPSVRFLGQRRDVRDLMAAADIHCQPNVGPEPFGIVFIEALHAKLPVVATRLGGALEIVDESCGVLVPCEAASVAAALDRLGRDPVERRRLGENGPARARALCDPDQQAQALHRAIAGLLARP